LWFGNIADGWQLLRPFLATNETGETKGEVQGSVTEMSYFDAMENVLMVPLYSLHESNWSLRSGLLPPLCNGQRVLTTELVSVIQNAFNTNIPLDWFMFGLVEPYGYAVAQVPSDATAFVHRKNAANLGVGMQWQNPEDGTQALAFVDAAWAALRPYFANSTTDPTAPMVYLNYIDAELTHFQASYYDTNYLRLQQVKAAYDPNNVFRYPQSIQLPSSSSSIFPSHP